MRSASRFAVSAFALSSLLVLVAGCAADPTDVPDDDVAETDSAWTATKLPSAGARKCTFVRKDARTLKYSCPDGTQGYVRGAAPGLAAVQATKAGATKITAVDRRTGKNGSIGTLDKKPLCVNASTACACEQATASCLDDPDSGRRPCVVCPLACGPDGRPTSENACGMGGSGGGSVDPCRILNGGCDDSIFGLISGDLRGAFCLGAAAFCSW